MAKKFSLSVRPYYDPPRTERVRLIGYDPLPLEIARDRLTRSWSGTAGTP